MTSARGSRCNKSEMNRTCSRGVDAANGAQKRQHLPGGFALRSPQKCSRESPDVCTDGGGFEKNGLRRRRVRNPRERG